MHGASKRPRAWPGSSKFERVRRRTFDCTPKHRALFAMPQLTVAEMGVIDGMVRSERKRPLDAWRALTTARQQIKVRGRKLKGPSKAAVYNYLTGHTHKRNKDETRGRHAILTRADVRKLMQARRRLIKSAAGESAVTYAMIMDEASLYKDVSKRVV